MWFLLASSATVVNIMYGLGRKGERGLEVVLIQILSLSLFCVWQPTVAHSCSALDTEAEKAFCPYLHSCSYLCMSSESSRIQKKQLKGSSSSSGWIVKPPCMDVQHKGSNGYIIWNGFLSIRKGFLNEPLYGFPSLLLTVQCISKAISQSDSCFSWAL